MLRNNWDGIDRREGLERRRTVRYEERRIDDMDQPVVERERIIEVSAPPANNNTQPKWLSPGITMPIIFSIITTIGGFVFTLYNRVTALEYKQTTLFEKVDDSKQADIEIKGMLKDQDATRQKLIDRISSIEETVMESLRHKQ